MIHYHGLPMWPAAAMINAMQCRHAMISYAEPRQIADAVEICQSVVLDNGAFSAWKAGRSLDFAGYQEWAREWLKHPAVEWCIVPDVIDGGEAENDDFLCAWNLPVHQSVPVYHMHESLARLDRLCYWPRLALGSSGRYSEPGSREWWARMAEIMRVVCDADGRPRCKLHGLRMLDPVIFSHVPLASADSCNVARNLGIDSRWVGPYAPRNKSTRALIMMDRIERHACARRWASESAGVQQNLELLG